VPPVFPFPPSSPYSSQVRFLNASTNGQDLDVWIDGRNIFSGSTFATVSSYIQVSDGFHTVTVRRTNGPALYRRTLSFISGEKVTMVLLDTPGGITLSRVSDMGCTNIPAGYGCLRVANMSYSGSNYDVRTFNNQIVFGGVGFKEVTTFKQTAAGNYTFFVTASQASLTGFAELPVILLTAITGGCSACMVNDPIMSFGINVRPGRVYTSYIIGNPWSICTGYIPWKAELPGPWHKTGGYIRPYPPSLFLIFFPSSVSRSHKPAHRRPQTRLRNRSAPAWGWRPSYRISPGPAG